jgi:regulator of sigma E protease
LFLENLHGFVVAVVSFIVLIGVMVLVHEFGHFIVAKLFRVRVEAFSIGFGPRLFGFKRGETDYKVCLLPLGGYVLMTGESMPGENMKLEGETKEQVEAHKADPGALTSHPRWQRILIGLAGPFANFVLAFVLMAFYYGFINEEPKFVVNSTTVEWVTPNSSGARAGIQAGDVIKSFDGVDNPDWMQVAGQISQNLGRSVQLTVERGGNSSQLTLQVPELPKGHDFDFTDIGILPERNLGPISVIDVSADTPAARAGLQAGDQIQAVDGLQFHYVETLLAYLQAYPGKQITLSVLRDGKLLDIIAQPEKMASVGWRLGFTSANPPLVRNPQPLGRALAMSRDFSVKNSTLIVNVLGGLFTRRVAVSQLSGPVGIARMAGQAAETSGWLPKFWTASAISLNLGILNLLPFPILDGGMILLLLIEGALRHDISLVVKERIYQAAFVVLVVFFAFIIFNDVTKLPIFTHVKP